MNTFSGLFKKAAVVFLFAGSFFCAGEAFAIVRAKVVVVNPSETQRQNLPVEYYLPPEISREDVLETHDMSVEYDVSKGLYYVTGKVELEPQEARTLEISIRDIWRIDEEEFEKAYELLDRKEELLEQGGEYADQVERIARDLRDEIDEIVSRQQSARDDIERRMRMFSGNRQQLESIRNRIFALEDIARRGDEGVSERDQSITLVLSAENRQDDSRQMTVEYYMPPDIQEQHILDAAGFDIEHDPIEGRLFVTREESFAPNELKVYRLKIRNIWNIPERKLENYEEESDEILEELEGTPSYEIGKVLKSSIDRNIEMIRMSQESVTNINDLVALHSLNRQRQRNIESDIEKMQLLITEQEEEPTHQVDKILEELEQLKIISELSERVAEYVKASVWEIIYTIVVFVIVVTALFYILWVKHMKKEGSKEYEVLSGEEDLEEDLEEEEEE